MPNPLVGAALTLALLLLPATASAGDVRTFQGAWFEIDAPADFAARPSLPSATADGVDSAFFASPDGTVEFYIYSPQWGGEPTDIALDPATETPGAKRVVTDGPVTRRWFTIEAKDGSYARSYLTTTDTRGPTSWTVGIRYRSLADLRRHEPEYLAFRDSLRQFAD